MFSRKEIIITEDSPLEIGQLKLYPNKLEYKGVRCNLLDIEHLGWYWLSKTISFVNTQEAKLSLFMRGREEPIFIKKTTAYVSPKIAKAYDYIARKTFQNRLSYYTSQLEKAGGFTYENCHFYTDGRVVSNGNVFSLAKAEIEPFEIKIKQDGIFSPKVRIGLYIDRDVILTLIDFILQNPQDPSVYIESHRQQQEADSKASYFLKDMMSLMAKLSSADGYVSPEEIDVIRVFLLDTMKLDQSSFAEAVTLFNNAKASPNSFEYFAESLFIRFSEDSSMLSAVLDLLFSVAIADGVLSAEEELLLLEAEAIFKIKCAAYRDFKSQTKEPKYDSKEYYLNVLGLEVGASKTEIKVAYKRLVRKFHPDRVHHLGDEFVKEAEIKMKEINKAYESLNK